MLGRDDADRLMVGLPVARRRRMPGPIKGAARRSALPEIRKIVKEELGSQLRPVSSEIRRLDGKMDSVRTESRPMTAIFLATVHPNKGADTSEQLDELAFR